MPVGDGRPQVFRNPSCEPPSPWWLLSSLIPTTPLQRWTTESGVGLQAEVIQTFSPFVLMLRFLGGRMGWSVHLAGVCGAGGGERLRSPQPSLSSFCLGSCWSAQAVPFYPWVPHVLIIIYNYASFHLQKKSWAINYRPPLSFSHFQSVPGTQSVSASLPRHPDAWRVLALAEVAGTYFSPEVSP